MSEYKKWERPPGIKTDGVITTCIAVPVELTDKLVYCKDCKFKRLYDGETKYYYCALEDRPNRNWSVDDWDFCSWGERKDDE